jgi:hypothetical protein
VALELSLRFPNTNVPMDSPAMTSGKLRGNIFVFEKNRWQASSVRSAALGTVALMKRVGPLDKVPWS